jgi:hypothetical protein
MQRCILARGQRIPLDVMMAGRETSRQLKHRRSLALTQLRDQHNLSIGKLQGIVVRAWIISIDFPESDHFSAIRISPEESERPVPVHLALKG